MWRLGVAMITATGLAMATLAADAPHALACSADGDFDPVASADVIVEGRFSAVQVLPDAPQPGAEGFDYENDGFLPVRVDMTVARALKGNPGPSIAIVDYRTYGALPDGTTHWGGGGSCGAFSDDPSGKYAIIGLTARPDGTYSPHLLHDFYIGDEPSGAEYDAALERLASFPGAASLPALGSAPDASPPVTRTLVGVAAGGLALTLLGFAIRTRSRGTT